MVLLLISLILMMVTHCRSYQLEAIRVAWSKLVLLKILVVGDGFGWASLSLILKETGCGFFVW